MGIPQKLVTELTRALPKASGAQINALSSVLELGYEQPHRHYHTFAHLEAMLSFMEQHFKELFVGDIRSHCVLATLFHDLIYDPQAKTNEERSAMIALMLLDSGFSGTNPVSIGQMILSTKEHKVKEGAPPKITEMFLDMDLSIFASSPRDYVLYTERIQKEYEWVPKPMYREARARILKGFLEREKLFYTPELPASVEEQARKNLWVELETLKI